MNWLRRFINAFRRPVLRVWKLGSLEHRMLPTPEAVQKLADILCQQDASEVVDVIWDCALDVIELNGTGKPNVILGPGIKMTKKGDVWVIEKEE